ncbi:MAG TPA: zf-HC2 domain-containing protein [Bacteroidota bacterium]
MTCNQFRRLITPAVDGRLQGEERARFDRHARECAPCREQYEIEAAVKIAVHRHVPRVKAPPALRESITRQIRGMDVEHLIRNTLVSRFRTFLKLPLLKPVAMIILASAAILVFVTTVRQVSPDEGMNLASYTVQAHRALESGELVPQVVSADPDRVQGFLSRQANLAVIVPLLADFALVGGLSDTYNGLHMAYVVYRQQNLLLSIVEMPLQDILHGKGLTLPLNIRNELLHNGWYAVDRGNGDALVLWTRGTTLCAAVARMERSALQSALGRRESGSPAEIPW